MVHLGRVATFKDLEDQKQATPDIDGLSLGPQGSDEYTTSVYGSRFAGLDLPKHEMPEDEMPKDIAYRMIK